jgi:hypothetical protein
MRAIHGTTGRFFIALAALIWAQAASAQLWGGTPGEFGGLIPDAPASAWLPCADGSCEDEEQAIEGSPAATPNARTRPALPAEAFDYSASSARRTQNLANFVTRTRAQSPQEAARLEQLFASTDIIGQIGGAIAPLGLSTTNVADAYTLYWISAWNGANGTETSPERAQVQAVRRQAAAALSMTSEIAGADNALKQEMAEVLLLQSALIDQAVTAAKNDPATLDQIARAVRQGASAAGLDVDHVTLTANGFIAR